MVAVVDEEGEGIVADVSVGEAVGDITVVVYNSEEESEESSVLTS